MPAQATKQGRLGKNPIPEKRLGFPHAGERHVNTHVGGGYFGGCDLSDPKAPEDSSTAHGDTLKYHCKG